MAQLSLVTLYGQKPAGLAVLITECQKRIAAIPGVKFEPYDMQQIHATLVSLERVEGSARQNLNLFRYRNQSADMDFDGLLSFVRKKGRFPFHIQVGGFQDQDYPFSSGGQRPYQRSFAIQNDKVVLMGWPIQKELPATGFHNVPDMIQESQAYPNILDDIRKSFLGYNILHSYHRHQNDVDNDFYFRIGLIDPLSITPALRENIESTIRTYLGAIAPVIFEINVSAIYVASYEENTLSPKSTKIWPITDPQVTADFMWKLLE